jgi:hypothetical protein
MQHDSECDGLPQYHFKAELDSVYVGVCNPPAECRTFACACVLQLLLSGVSAEEHLEGTIADPELLMEVSLYLEAALGQGAAAAVTAAVATTTVRIPVSFAW